MALTVSTLLIEPGYATAPMMPPARLEVLPAANTITVPLPPRPSVTARPMALVMALLAAPPPQLLFITCAPLYQAVLMACAIWLSDAAQPLLSKMRMGMIPTPGAMPAEPMPLLWSARITPATSVPWLTVVPGFTEQW